MSKPSIKITIPSGFKTELQNYGNQIARNLALTFKQELVQEYQRSIERFYGEYTPKVYKRHGQLTESFRPYYRNPHGTRFHGGVEITSDSMKNVYNDSPSEVLLTAISGYHGRPELGIWSIPPIYDHMLQYRDMLFLHAESFVDGAVKASAGTYGKFTFT